MTFDLAVCGLGYVGLALAREACAAGLSVIGYDSSRSVIAGLAAGRSHVDDVSDDDFAAMTAAGFVVTGEPTALGRAAVTTICVPTPLDDQGNPDLTAARRAGEVVAGQLQPGMLVVLESTSFPGTTEEVLRPILEAGSGLVAGIDFHLASSPERVDPGNRSYTLAKTPKVVGGFTPACTTVAARFYRRFVNHVVEAKGTREAEMAKLLENTYRYVNIGLVNEFAMLCERFGVDVWDVIECAASKPFGFQRFTPGPGVGGHCIPVDPRYLAHRARQLDCPTHFIDCAEAINSRMPRYVVERCADLLRARGCDLDQARVWLLGVTYKADVADLRMSPAYPVARELRRRGARLAYHDPYVQAWEVDGVPVRRVVDLADALRNADLTILLQPHRAYQAPVLADMSRLLFDTRGILAGHDGDNVMVL